MTRSISSGSTFPPDSTTTTGGSNADEVARTAATPAAPAGSTTSFARSSNMTSARASQSSLDGDNAVAQCLDQPERNVTGTGDRDPVGHGRHGLQRHRPAGVERRRVGGGADRLHADQPYVGASVLDRERDACQQTAAACTDDDRADVGALLDDLQADRRLSGDDVGMVERMDEDRPRLGGELLGRDQCLVDGRADESDVRAVGTGGLLLDDRRTFGHEHRRLGVEHARRQRHPLGVVPGAGRHDALGPFVFGEPGNADVCSADLERSGALQVFTFEKDRSADDPGQPARHLQRRRAHDVAQEFARRVHIVHRHRSCQRSPLPGDTSATASRRGKTVTVMTGARRRADRHLPVASADPGSCSAG